MGDLVQKRREEKGQIDFAADCIPFNIHQLVYRRAKESELFDYSKALLCPLALQLPALRQRNRSQCQNATHPYTLNDVLCASSKYNLWQRGTRLRIL